MQSKWLPAVAATALIGAVVAAGVAGGFSGDDGGDASQTVPSTVTTGRPRKPSSKPVATVAVTTVPADRKTKLSGSLSLGSTGEEVRAVQQRLKQLKFDPGPVDGQFGELTRTAVWGFEKLIMGTPSGDATGSVTPSMWKRMQDDIIIKPRRPNSTPDHTEVYLPEQMVIFFHDDEPALVSHMSSGNNEEWCDEVTISPGEYGNEDGEEPLVRGECGLSWTPGGVYSYYREVTGVRQSGLGGMWNPIYFNYGIAIHGALNVPLEPASHGCIRIPLPVSEYIQEIMEIGDQVFVFDGVEEPEAYGDQPPRFNWKDPDWVPPTTLPPTTLPATTLEPTVPPTTQPPTTTTTPRTTTTRPPPPPTTTTTVPPPAPTTLAPTPTSGPLGPPRT
jgi:peptidoglycan hydrolase-like protein with peptidoglycan-binding domain